MIPRPATEDVKDIVEEETGLDWTLRTDEPDKISLVAVSYRLDLVWDGSKWTIELFDAASSHGDEEPRWAEGPMRNATEILETIPGFIPHEVRA